MSVPTHVENDQTQVRHDYIITKALQQKMIHYCHRRSSWLYHHKSIAICSTIVTDVHRRQRLSDFSRRRRGWQHPNRISYHVNIVVSIIIILSMVRSTAAKQKAERSSSLETSRQFVFSNFIPLEPHFLQLYPTWTLSPQAAKAVREADTGGDLQAEGATCPVVGHCAETGCSW